MERTCARGRVRIDTAHASVGASPTRRPDRPRALTPAGPPGPSLGGTLYEVVWSAGAIQVVVLMGHLIGVILFAVDDLDAALRSLAGFSLFVWALAGLYLIPTLVTCLTPSPFRGGTLTDGYLDAPWFEFGGGKPGPVADDG